MAVMIVSDSNWDVMEHGVFCSNLHIFEPHFAFVFGGDIFVVSWLRPVVVCSLSSLNVPGLHIPSFGFGRACKTVSCHELGSLKKLDSSPTVSMSNWPTPSILIRMIQRSNVQGRTQACPSSQDVYVLCVVLQVREECTFLFTSYCFHTTQ